MLKNLPLNPENTALILAFEKHLKVVGYSFAKRAPSAVKELLWRMEKQAKNITQITSDDLLNHNHYLQQRPNYNRPGGLSDQTINNYFYSLKMFFNYVEKTGIIDSNPMSVLSFDFKPESKRKILSKSQISQLYRACRNGQERAILSLFYGCGLRRSEGEKLNIKDINFGSNLLFVRSGKGKKRRVVPLIESVVNDLRNYRFKERPNQESKWTKVDDRKAFMLNKIGTRMRGDSYWNSFKKILKNSGLKEDVSLHNLRHSIATHLLGEGMSIEQVRDFLGHEHLESTQIYTRVETEQLKL